MEDPLDAHRRHRDGKREFLLPFRALEDYRRQIREPCRLDHAPGNDAPFAECSDILVIGLPVAGATVDIASGFGGETGQRERFPLGTVKGKRGSLVLEATGVDFLFVGDGFGSGFEAVSGRCCDILRI